MKEQALSIVKSEPNHRLAKNYLREYLQHVVLREFFEQGVLENLIFHGGTALRILHDLPRFSEDLDFHKRATGIKFTADEIGTRLEKSLGLAGYTVTCKSTGQKAVRSLWVQFKGLPYEAGLSPHHDEKLSVRVEVDTNPPGGYGSERSLVNMFFPFAVIHHDRPTLLAGKLHAVLQRQYVKGRDYYDLMFYLSRWKHLEPNLEYLGNALVQTDYLKELPTQQTWRDMVISRIKEVDWNEVTTDVSPFVERESDLPLIDQSLLVKLLEEA